MTVLSAIQNACLVIGIDKPDAVYSATAREFLELGRLANEVAQAICEAHDWQKLQAVETITGDGTTEAHELPSDYDRMLKTASVWSSRWTWAINHITDPDVWLEYQEVPYTFVNGNWIIYGGQMHILPVMSGTETARYFYIKNTRVVPASGSNKALFTLDTDSFILDERLLELGMIWQWRANKGLPYEEDLVTFDALFTSKASKDGGSQHIVSGSPVQWKRSGAWAFPQTVGS